MRLPVRAAIARLAVPAIVLALCGLAAAETVENKEHRYRLELPAGFESVSQTAGGTVASYRDKARGFSVSIARIDYPNLAAWRNKTEFFESVEAGVKDAATDYKRLDKKRHKVGRVPAMDLWFSRKHTGDRDVVAVRFLFFRRYTVVMSVAMTKDAYKRHKARAKKLLKSFKTYFGS